MIGGEDILRKLQEYDKMQERERKSRTKTRGKSDLMENNKNETFQQGSFTAKMEIGLHKWGPQLPEENPA